MAVRYYSSTAAETTLSGTINSSATGINVGSAVGFPVSFPYTLALDYEGASEELVDVTAAAGTSLTIVRGVDSTSATSHTAGARVRHVSSARDFRDSREHEEDVSAVHGVTGALVGTTDTQSLSNKTLVNATGTLNRIDILSEGAPWVTTINGDIDNNNDLTSWKRGPSEPHEVAKFTNNGGLVVRNQNAGADAVSNVYRLRVVKDNGTTDIFAVLSGGSQSNWLDADATGIRVIPNAAGSGVATIASMDPTNATRRWAVFRDGHQEIVGAEAAIQQLNIMAAAGQAVSIFRIQDASSNTLVQVDQNGQLQAQAGLVANTISNGSDFTSVATTATSGIFTAASGWSILEQAGVRRGGMTTVYANISRTGADIPAGSAGNIADTDMATIGAAWRPNATFQGVTALMPSCITDGFGDGGARLAADSGLITLVSWSSDGSVVTGRNYRFSMTYHS